VAISDQERCAGVSPDHSITVAQRTSQHAVRKPAHVWVPSRKIEYLASGRSPIRSLAILQPLDLGVGLRHFFAVAPAARRLFRRPLAGLRRAK